MKKLIFGLTALFMLSLNSYGQGFEESVAIITGKRVTSQSAGNQKSAKSVFIKSFNTNYKLNTTVFINNATFTDDGRNNDLKANDGIYTSVDFFTNPANQDNVNKAIISSKFIYKSELTTYAQANKVGIGVSCKLGYTESGTSALGFSCWSGCITICCCEFTFDIGF